MRRVITIRICQSLLRAVTFGTGSIWRSIRRNRRRCVICWSVFCSTSDWKSTNSPAAARHSTGCHKPVEFTNHRCIQTSRLTRCQRRRTHGISATVATNAKGRKSRPMVCLSVNGSLFNTRTVSDDDADSGGGGKFPRVIDSIVPGAAGVHNLVSHLLERRFHSPRAARKSRQRAGSRTTRVRSGSVVPVGRRH
jgi:hypothetical protein